MEKNIADIFLQKKVFTQMIYQIIIIEFFDEDFLENQTVKAYLLKIDDNYIRLLVKIYSNQILSTYNSKLEDSENLKTILQKNNML